MKKTILVLITVLLTCGYAFSQVDITEVSNTKGRRIVTASQQDYYNWATGPERWARTSLNEIGIGYGLFTPFSSLIRNGKTLDHKMSTGLISVGYMHYLKFGGAAFGASLGYEHINATYVDPDIDGETEEVVMNILSFVPTAKFMWFNRPKFSIYTLLNAGASFYLKNGKTYFLPAFQLDLICADFGGDRVRGFTEIGWGTQHIVNLGIKALF